MSLITGCAKMIPFHYHVHCQTASSTERCQITNQCQFWRHYVPVLFLRLADLCCCCRLNCLDLVVSVFTYCYCHSDLYWVLKIGVGTAVG